jgi:uncharacterized protein YqeY
MDIRAKLLEDVKSAMKERAQVRLDALRFVQSAIKNREIELRPNPISDDEILGVLRKLVKQRKESIEQYKQGGRQDLVDKELSELKVIEAYLPQAMDRGELEKIVKDVITTLNAKSPKEMGAVMKEVQAKTAGRADNKMVSEIVKGLLQP